jgi:proteasome accessory factor A
MAIPKVMGIETEYGITVRNQPDFNPILSSLLLINSYETYRTARIRWDYEAESPPGRAGLRVRRGEGAALQGGVAAHQPDPQ